MPEGKRDPGDVPAVSPKLPVAWWDTCQEEGGPELRGEEPSGGAAAQVAATLSRCCCCASCDVKYVWLTDQFRLLETFNHLKGACTLTQA